MADEPYHRTTLVDVDVPFTRLVAFFVKAGLAMIPAAIIVWLILALIALALRALFGVGFWSMHSI
ncbi:MAG TPA: hypothetical protein VIL72_00205 [Beijerinckiaceae bacterium]